MTWPRRSSNTTAQRDTLKTYRLSVFWKLYLYVMLMMVIWGHDQTQRDCANYLNMYGLEYRTDFFLRFFSIKQGIYISCSIFIYNNNYFIKLLLSNVAEANLALNQTKKLPKPHKPTYFHLYSHFLMLNLNLKLRLKLLRNLNFRHEKLLILCDTFKMWKRLSSAIQAGCDVIVSSVFLCILHVFVIDCGPCM